MGKRKFLILSILTIFLVAMSLSVVNASSNNKKVKSVSFKINKPTQSKILKNGDCIQYFYEPSSDKGYFSHSVCVGFYPANDYSLSYKNEFVKTTVWFKKKGKTIKITTSKVSAKWHVSKIKIKKGYKPYKVKIYYKTLNKNQKVRYYGDNMEYSVVYHKSKY